MELPKDIEAYLKRYSSTRAATAQLPKETAPTTASAIEGTYPYMMISVSPDLLGFGKLGSTYPFANNCRIIAVNLCFYLQNR
jgi:hypothetical protein